MRSLPATPSRLTRWLRLPDGRSVLCVGFLAPPSLAAHVGITVIDLATGDEERVLVPDTWDTLRPAAIVAAIARAKAVRAALAVRPCVGAPADRNVLR